MYYVYILKSLIAEKTYVGFTKDLDQRIRDHNSGKSTYTKKYKPWKIIYTEEFSSLEEAVRKEKYYKSAAGRRKLKTIINHLPT